MKIRMFCDICGSTKLKTVYRFYNYDVFRCLDCKTLSRNVTLDKDESKKLYGEDYFCNLQEDYFFKNISLREKAFESKASLLNEIYPKKGKLLDLGCATGLFLKQAILNGWDAQGVEFSEFAAKYAVENEKLKVQCGDIMDMHFPSNHFDVVTMWDMVDHSESPGGVIKEVYRILKPGGVIAMDTFMEDGIIFALANLLYKATFGIIKYPCFKGHPFHHSHYFSTKTFKNLLESNSFEIVISKPSYLDAEIISLNNYEKRVIAIMNYLSKYVGKQMEMIVFGKKL